MRCAWLRKRRALWRRRHDKPAFVPGRRYRGRLWPAYPAQGGETDDDVRVCLALLSGRRHQVLTAVALLTPDGKLRTRVAMTRVSFLRLTDRQIAAYIDSREGLGKAGGYAIQGRAEIFVKEIAGSYSNVVGLPLSLTVQLLAGCGYPVL